MTVREIFSDADVRRMVKVAETDSKEDHDELYEDADYIVDEKAKTATLTQNGVRKAEEEGHEGAAHRGNGELQGPSPGEEPAQRTEAVHPVPGGGQQTPGGPGCEF